MDANELTVHDITIQDSPSFGLSGQVTTKTSVTFYVGTHGPFRMTYDKAAATSDRINSDIDHQVAELRRVVTRP